MDVVAAAVNVVDVAFAVVVVNIIAVNVLLLLFLQ